MKPNTGSANAPSFNGQTGYTRRGDFAPDANGYLVNGAGYYLFAGPSASTPVQVSTGSASPASLTVSPTGALTASNADGSTRSLGTMTLAQFDGPENLAPSTAAPTSPPMLRGRRATASRDRASPPARSSNRTPTSRTSSPR
ncbi:hypothetical protein ACFQE0_05670 [Methylobacterium komagatae]|uniref:Flagellar hook protein FlgE/F/G-like D1 domain-containing protein n=1 Tax=Methylobacterium komagatae TaxID=374425 RepID=A0ABW2BGD4_9HYPH